MDRRSLLARAAVAGVLAATLVGIVPACDPSYVAPCRLARRDAIALGPASRARLQRAGARVVASVSEHAPAETPDAQRAVTGLALLVLDASFAAPVTRAVALPPALASRREGVVELTAAIDDDDAIVVAWVDTAVVTAEDGRRIPSASLRIAAPGGASRTVTTCDDCSLAVALAPSGTGHGFVAVVRTAPFVRPVALGAYVPPPTFTLVTLAPDGVTSSSTDAPWVASGRLVGVSEATSALDADAMARGDLAAHVDARGELVVRADGRVYRLDRALRLVGPPRVLPSADALLAVDDLGAASLAFSLSPAELGGTPDDGSEERGVFVESAGDRRRLSSGRLVLGFDRAVGGGAVAFESAGDVWLSVLGPDDAKRGGDVRVLEATRGGDVTTGVPSTRRPVVVLSDGADRHVVVALEGTSLTRAEVTCAP